MKRLIAVGIIFLSLCSTSFGQKSVKPENKTTSGVIPPKDHRAEVEDYSETASEPVYEFRPVMYNQAATVINIDTSICTDRQFIKFAGSVYTFRINTCVNTPWKNQLVITGYPIKHEVNTPYLCSSIFSLSKNAHDFSVQITELPYSKSEVIKFTYKDESEKEVVIEVLHNY